MLTDRNFWKQVFLAWVLFIGIDFFFHAGITNWLWSPEIEAFKAEEDLFRLIPAGYGSFLFLVILMAYVYNRLGERTKEFSFTVKFAFTFGLLFSASYFLGLFSFVNIPAFHLGIFSLIYFIEILGAVLVFYYFTQLSFGKLSLYVFIIFFSLLILGIITQNITQNLA